MQFKSTFLNKRNIITGNILSGSCLCHSISTSGKRLNNGTVSVKTVVLLINMNCMLLIKTEIDGLSLFI